MTPDQAEAVETMCQYAAGYAAFLLIVAGGLCKALDKWWHR